MKGEHWECLPSRSCVRVRPHIWPTLSGELPQRTSSSERLNLMYTGLVNSAHQQQKASGRYRTAHRSEQNNHRLWQATSSLLNITTIIRGYSLTETRCGVRTFRKPLWHHNDGTKSWPWRENEWMCQKAGFHWYEIKFRPRGRYLRSQPEYVGCDHDHDGRWRWGSRTRSGIQISKIAPLHDNQPATPLRVCDNDRSVFPRISTDANLNVTLKWACLNLLRVA